MLIDHCVVDTNSVMLRLPDGTLQSMEDYIIGIIKDASSQLENERQNASTSADDTLDQSAADENLQTPSKTATNNTCEKDSTRNLISSFKFLSYLHK